jgi:hypothetical protein
MRTVKSFVMFWYDFIVGDDWTVAVGVVLAILLTGALTHAHINAWWLIPAAAVVLLAVSLLRAAQTSPHPRRRPPAD